MTFDLKSVTIAPSCVVAVIIVDDHGLEHRVDCEPPPKDVSVLQFVRGDLTTSSRAFWTAEAAQVEHTALITTARRLGLMSTVTSPPA